MFRPELYHPDDPELVRAREQARALLYPPAADTPDSGGDIRAGVAAWSLVHGLATLWLNHSLPPSWATTPSRSPATSPTTSSEMPSCTARSPLSPPLSANVGALAVLHWVVPWLAGVVASKAPQRRKPPMCLEAPGCRGQSGRKGTA